MAMIQPMSSGRPSLLLRKCSRACVTQALPHLSVAGGGSLCGSMLRFVYKREDLGQLNGLDRLGPIEGLFL